MDFANDLGKTLIPENIKDGKLNKILSSITSSPVQEVGIEPEIKIEMNQTPQPVINPNITHEIHQVQVKEIPKPIIKLPQPKVHFSNNASQTVAPTPAVEPITKKSFFADLNLPTSTIFFFITLVGIGIAFYLSKNSKSHKKEKEKEKEDEK